jgi:tryptophan synthase alpha chain
VALEETLRARRAAGAKLLVPYVMAGMTPDWVEVLEALTAAGADAIEVGIPFSDPMIDGPVIQEASVRALGAGTTPTTVLEALGRTGFDVPLVVMTYYNLIFRMGHRRAAQTMGEAGVAGVLLPDLPLEELGPWAAAADEAGIETVLLVAPSTPEERVRRICDRARGFVYAVARMGVTGEQASLGDEAAKVVGRITAVSDRPVCVGIGISTPEQAAQVCHVADGAVVGSALVRRLLEGAGPDGAHAFVGQLRAGIDAGT